MHIIPLCVLWKLGAELSGGGDLGLTTQNYFDSSHSWELGSRS